MINFFRPKRLLIAALQLAVAGTVLGVLALEPGVAQQIYRDPFESAAPTWIKGPADVEFVEKMHTRTARGANKGQRCEYIHIEAKQGSHIHYQYPTKRAPIGDELSVGVYVKSNRRDLQILARVVLPHERNPKSLDIPVTTFIRGDRYRFVGRWQKLEIPRPKLAAQRQQQLMQAETKRSVNIKDAYVDMIILNVYGGSGKNEIWIDDLQIGPVLKDDGVAVAPNPGIKPPIRPDVPNPPARAATVEFSGSHLLVGGKRFFIRGIRHSDTPLNVLRDAGFNTVFLSHEAKPQLMSEASRLGFWLVPSFSQKKKTNYLVSRNALGRQVSGFPQRNSVLFYNFGNSLMYEQIATVDQSARLVKSVDVGRPVGADVWDGFLPYSRSLDIVGMHRWPLMTELELTSYRKWLNQRRLLANPGTYTWTWIQTHVPEYLSNQLYNQTSQKEFHSVVGPQPAQVRLLTYTALGAGCRGVAFWSDRFLADSHHGRDRLLECALLNKELEMLEPLLLTVEGSPQWIKTSEANVPAAVFRTKKGILVLPMWLGKGAQFVPGQSAATKLKIKVPQVPPGHSAWEVTPGEVRGLRTKRVVGGTQITLPEFGLTTAIVFTSDTRLLHRLQTHCRAIRQLAAQWTFRQAQQQITKVARVQQELQRQNQSLSEASVMLGQAQTRLQAAKVHWDNRLFAEAYRESQRALRPVRILMRAQWERATKSIGSPVAIPHAVSYYTLPKYWETIGEIQSTSPGVNLLTAGDFEFTDKAGQRDWMPQSVKLDNVDLRFEFVGKGMKSVVGNPVEAKSGRLCAMLNVQPRDKGTRVAALERTYLALNSRTVRLKPGSLVRISGWLHVPRPIQASVDGVLFFDSAGGEPLAVRITEPTAWKKISLYRRVPASGDISVTLALSGIGTAYFDDIRIEPLLSEKR